jgi:ribosomal protein S18 acetylase RimI-like enzyme
MAAEGKRMSVTPLPPEERNSLRSLIVSRRPGEALAAYYAFHHPASRTRIWSHRSASGRIDGFLVRAQTGQDLFRPLITLRAPDSAAMAELMRAALPSGQPALFSFPETLSVWLLPLLSIDTRQRLLVYLLNPSKFVPVTNIFVRRASSPDGLARFEIRQGDSLAAAAGINWQSPEWAEIFVQTDPQTQERGYGKSVCAALCAHLLEQKRSVLFAVEENNRPSIRLAKSIGFEDSGESEILCTGSISES